MVVTDEWETDTGRLISGNFHTYTWRELKSGRRTIERTNPNGGVEWYVFDRATWTSPLRRIDGSRVVTRHIGEPGYIYMKPCQIEILTESGQPAASMDFTYAADGKFTSLKETIVAPFQTGPRISFKEARGLFQSSGVLFLDARRAAVFRRGHVSGARDLSQLHFERDLARLKPQIDQAQTLVVYCDSIRCEDSGIVAARLSGHGYADVSIFDEGWARWWRENRLSGLIEIGEETDEVPTKE